MLLQASSGFGESARTSIRPRTERENLADDAKGKGASGSQREAESTARTHGVGRLERMKQLKRTPSWVWLIIGLIGLALAAHEDIFALVKARQAALELHGTN